ncbi:hypothetical protein ABZV15_33730, partial [Streptomyces sp. NPDC005246]
RYKQRNVVERCFNALKQYRAIATRYDKTRESSRCLSPRSRRRASRSDSAERSAPPPWRSSFSCPCRGARF